ncbi:MAG: RsmE family RNA methyltransferase [Candidatus Omnitrophica bacterium]|nr:RsmE family RNA methyltransferase [Candidatus Omnitrophota bacterium]MDD5352624.1 RsmE family RNA methyltransferase [Candidatus Omnitrophota bacterium]MDD5550223.1 RsmE family RNA methyltransferase [Candidatus Omnitrophota bacterium]
MRRFFCNPQHINSHQINILDKDELHHLKDVLRLKNQDKVTVIDGNGTELICEISHLGKHGAKLNILERHTYKKEELPLRLTVACAVPKKSKIDFIVEKLTEIGTEKIILLKTERTEVNLKDYSRKLVRFKKIAESSLKQSGNLFLPQIDFLNFEGLMRLKLDGDFDLAVIPNLAGSTQNLKDVLEKKPAKNILVAIGPEGDFSKEEIDSAQQAGFISVSLGDSVLKVDTAAIVAAGFIKLYFS